MRDKGADLIVVLSHRGLPQDIALARIAPDADVILSGHTHNRLTKPVRVGKTVTIQSGCHSSFIGRLDLKVARGQVADFSHELITIDDRYDENHDMTVLVETR